MGKFGWSYPAGCDSTPFDEFPPCEVCGNDPDGDCTCPECPVCGEAGNPACYKEHGLKPKVAAMVPESEWVQFTKRTDDPKLRYLEHRLDEMGIPHRRHGESWHAPIMQVPRADHERAYALLAEVVDMTGCPDEVEGKTVRLDDLEDDDIMFREFAQPEDEDDILFSEWA